MVRKRNKSGRNVRKLDEFTRMTRRRFDEIRLGALDGSLAAKWRTVKAKYGSEIAGLNRRLSTEHTQVRFFLMLAEENPDYMQELVHDSDWIRMIVLVDLKREETLVRLVYRTQEALEQSGRRKTQNEAG